MKKLNKRKILNWMKEALPYLKVVVGFGSGILLYLFLQSTPVFFLKCMSVYFIALGLNGLFWIYISHSVNKMWKKELDEDRKASNEK